MYDALDHTKLYNRYNSLHSQPATSSGYIVLPPPRFLLHLGCGYPRHPLPGPTSSPPVTRHRPPLLLHPTAHRRPPPHLPVSPPCLPAASPPHPSTSSISINLCLLSTTHQKTPAMTLLCIRPTPATPTTGSFPTTPRSSHTWTTTFCAS